MEKKPNTVSKALERLEDTGPALPRIEPAEFAAALGAEPIGAPRSKHLDLVSLGELGNQLIKRLRSTGGRPALADATHRCKVPLSSDDIAALEEIIEVLERETGAKPSLGQIASVILRTHLEGLKNGCQAQDRSKILDSKNTMEMSEPMEAKVSELVEDKLKAVLEQFSLGLQRKSLQSPK